MALVGGNIKVEACDVGVEELPANQLAPFNYKPSGRKILRLLHENGYTTISEYKRAEAEIFKDQEPEEFLWPEINGCKFAIKRMKYIEEVFVQTLAKAGIADYIVG